MDPSVSLFLLERWRKIHHGGWRWTLYYSRNRSRLTYVCHSSVISIRGPASPFRPTILCSLKSSQFVSRTAMKPRRIVAESPRRISFRRIWNDRGKPSTAYVLYTQVKENVRTIRFPPEGIETILDPMTPRVWYSWYRSMRRVNREHFYRYFSWKKKQGDEGKKICCHVIFKVLEQNAWNGSIGSKGWKIVV